PAILLIRHTNITNPIEAEFSAAFGTLQTNSTLVARQYPAQRRLPARRPDADTSDIIVNARRPSSRMRLSQNLPSGRGRSGRPGSATMADFYGKETSKQLRKLRQMAPDAFKGFLDFDQVVFKDGAIPSKTKELMAITAAHVTQCPWCIEAHVSRAK